MSQNQSHYAGGSNHPEAIRQAVAQFNYLKQQRLGILKSRVATYLSDCSERKKQAAEIEGKINHAKNAIQTEAQAISLKKTAKQQLEREVETAKQKKIKTDDSVSVFQRQASDTPGMFDLTKFDCAINAQEHAVLEYAQKINQCAEVVREIEVLDASKNLLTEELKSLEHELQYNQRYLNGLFHDISVLKRETELELKRVN